jgi:phosphatidylglycerophosphate synthase
VIAHTADTLTLARLGFALMLVGAVATHRFALATWLLVGAWVSDALDGRLARATTRATRLGELDLTVDTAVGAGLLTGLGFAGHLPVPLALSVVVVLGGGFLVLRNAALALALQAVAYSWFIVVLWAEQAGTRWVPPAAAAALLIVGYRRLVTVVVPAFVTGTAALARLRRGGGFELPHRSGKPPRPGPS